MTNARNLAIDIFNSVQLTDSVSKTEQLILAHDDAIRRETLDDVIETSRMVQRDFDGRTGMYWEEWVLNLDEAFDHDNHLGNEPERKES
jgi:hypothetical protein